MTKEKHNQIVLAGSIFGGIVGSVITYLLYRQK